MSDGRPTLLSSCARAASASEARYRIDGDEFAPRSTRIIALDHAASEVVERVADGPWRGARFLTYESALPVGGGQAVTVDAVMRGVAEADAVLRDRDGGSSRLSEELEDVDVVVMTATSDEGAEGAHLIGAACAGAGIMTAGLATLPAGVAGPETDRAISMLRPYAMVLLVSKDADDLPELLTALRA